MGLRHRIHLDESGLGPRPKDLCEILFDRSCFKKIGESYASRFGCEVAPVKVSVIKRIK